MADDKKIPDVRQAEAKDAAAKEADGRAAAAETAKRNETMVPLTIIKPFDFTSQDGQVHHIPIGVHEMPIDMAEHWFVLAHSDNPPVVEPKPGTPEFGFAQAAAMRRRKFVEMQVEEEAARAAAEVRTEARTSGAMQKAELQFKDEEDEENERLAKAAAENEAARTGRPVAPTMLRRAPEPIMSPQRAPEPPKPPVPPKAA